MKALVVKRAGTNPTLDELRASCRQNLAPYRSPMTSSSENPSRRPWPERSCGGRWSRNTRRLRSQRPADLSVCPLRILPISQWSHSNACLFEPPCTATASPAAPGVSPCTQIVSTLSGNVEPSRATTSPSHHTHGPLDRRPGRVRQHRTSEMPRRQRSVALVPRRSANASAATGKGQPQCPAGGVPIQATLASTERAVERRDRPRDGLGDVGTPHAHVVQRAVRLDVPKRRTFSFRDRAQRCRSGK